MDVLEHDMWQHHTFYLDFVHGTTLYCLVIAINTFTFFAILKVAKVNFATFDTLTNLNVL